MFSSFAYQYDNVGNRKKAWSGGDNQGANLRETLYYANSLNQYTIVQTPGYKHVAGAAFATNTVLVNGGTPERRGEWFDREITVANASSPVWQTVSVTDGTVTTNGGFVFPKGRGRDRGCPRPPAQIRAGGITALGSYLEFWRRNAPMAMDDRF